MEDIYGDLENFNDVNAIDELRNDNKQLKIKVEENEAEIARLQKRINFLETEHTRISTNYSSLLKTAKAEVERKSQIITTLNQEKDAMVLNSLKNNDKSLLNIRRNLLRNNHINHTTSSTIPKESRTKNDLINHTKKPENPKEPDTRKSDIERDRRKDEHRFPSEDTVTTSGNTDETNNHPADKKADSFHEKLDSKENSPIRSRAQGIRNRRKSMPVSKQTTYTSDEENDSGKEHKADRSREDKYRRIERDSKHKVSETSGIDDKYSSHRDSSRETYHKSKHRHSDRDRYRSHKDKHDPRRRRDSTERRRPMEYPDRLDDRHRVLDSPPVEKPHEYRRARERQSNLDGPYGERSRSRHDNRPPKHKLHLPNVEEPVSKRTRTDSSSRLTEEPIPKPKTEYNRLMEETISKPRTVANKLTEETISKQFRTDYNRQTEESIPKPRTESNRLFDQEKPIPQPKTEYNRPSGQHEQLNKNETSKQARTEYKIEKVAEVKKLSEDKIVDWNLHEDSCRSPDYNLVEVAKNVPREIKLTSSSKLDDPRLKSSKYILKTDSEKKTLSTAIGRNVDIKKIDKSNWINSTPKVPLPEALRKPPENNLVQDHKSTCYDKLVEDVYMDIENPVSNLSVDISMESGEIHSDTNDTPYARAVAASFFADYDNINNQTKSDRFTHTKTINDNKITFDSKPPNVFPEKIKINNEVASITKSQNSSSERNTRNDDNAHHIKKKPQKDTSSSDANVNKHLDSYKIPMKSDPATKTQEHKKDVIRELPKEKLKSSTEKRSPTTTNVQETKLNKPMEKSSQSYKEEISNKESINASSNSNSSRTLQSSNESLQDANTSKPKIVLKLSELKGYRKLSPREIVAGDLELSDDTNDFSFSAFSRKESKPKRKHSHDEKSNTNTKDLQSETVDQGDKIVANPIDDKKEKRKSKSNKNGNTAKDSNSADSTKTNKKSADKIAGTNTVEDQQSEIHIAKNKTVPVDKKTNLKDLFGDNPSSSLKDAEGSAQKPSHKGSRDTDPNEAVVEHAKTKDIPNSDKTKTRISDEKLKFTELFGDSLSCSLLTPEDLGLNTVSTAPSDNYVPIFEDAQDAVDINVEQIDNENTLCTVQDNLNKTLIETNTEKNVISYKSTVATVQDTLSDKSNQVPKTDKHEDLDVKAIYENLLPGDEDTKDTEVVKTVILATGSQSQTRDNHDNNSPQTNVIENNNLVEPNIGLPNLQEVPLHALATSTPYKPLTVNVHETPQNMPSVHETSQKLGSVHEASQKLASVQETSQKLGSVHETSQKLASVHEASQKLASVQETSQKLGSVHETSQKLASVQETSQKLGSVHETQQKLASVHETSQKMPSVHETSQKLANVDEVTESSSNTSSLACSRSSTVDQSSTSSPQVKSEAPVRIILKRRTGKKR